MKKACIIYNPTLGKKSLRKNLADILQTLEETGFEASAHAATSEPDSAKNETRRAAELGFDLVATAGGDGTVNEVVSGIAPLEHRPKMAIIPADTTNDCVRALKIPRDNIEAAVEAVKEYQIVRTDIGLSDNGYFIGIAAGDYLTELTYEVSSELKSIFGYLAYPAKEAEMLPRVKPIKMRLKYDEGEYIGNASMFLLGLTGSVGGLEQAAPDAKLDDDKFSSIIVKTANIFEILHIAAFVLDGGRHVGDPRVICTKTSSLFVKMEDDINRPVMINLDGECGGEAPMHSQNLHQHIEFSVDTDQIPNETVTDTDEEELEVVSKELVKEIRRLTDEDIDGDGRITDETPSRKD